MNALAEHLRGRRIAGVIATAYCAAT